MHRSYRGLTFVLFLIFTGAGPAWGFQGLVDEIWAHTKSKPRVRCQKFVVQAGPPQVLRGKTSGQDCLKHAVTANREGDHEEALGWILAGQCQSRDARLTLVQKAPKVMQYVMDTYGPEVDKDGLGSGVSGK